MNLTGHTRGVPQGSIPGPALFCGSIHPLDAAGECTNSKFAADPDWEVLWVLLRDKSNCAEHKG